jgi:RNA polymerase sigma-70 factor (ECF subfamily)
VATADIGAGAQAGGDAKTVASGVRRRTPSVSAEFEVFYQEYQEVWRAYAYARTGSLEAADQVIDEVTAQLADLWACASGPDDVGRYAWALLRTTIVRWLNDHQTRSAFVETLAFDRTALAMDFVRERFNLIEESLTLYAAISRLPEREYDVTVLRYVLGFPVAQVAAVLNIDTRSVGRHIRSAKQRLARELGLCAPASDGH